MNKTLFAVIVGLVLVITLALPLRRGTLMNCDDGVFERMRVVGLPFGFYKTTGESHMICMPKGQTLHSPDNRLISSFETAALWFDLMISGAVLLGAYAALDYKKVIK